MRSRQRAQEAALSVESRPRPPSVERVLARLRGDGLGGRAAEALTGAAREAVADERSRLANGAAPRSLDEIAELARVRLDGLAARPPAVINATGVLIHTNLGRVAWPQAAIDAAVA